MISNVEINSECKTAFAKAKKLIAKRKKEFNRIPEIQEFDNGNILIQFFENWTAYWGNLKKREFESVHLDDKIIVAVYSEKNTTINVDGFKKQKTYMIINGEIDFNFNNDIKKVSTFQTITIPKNMEYSVNVIRDTYVIVVEE